MGILSSGDMRHSLSSVCVRWDKKALVSTDWHSGDGCDSQIYMGDVLIHSIDLDDCEIHALVTSWVALGLVDLDEVSADAERLKENKRF